MNTPPSPPEPEYLQRRCAQRQLAKLMQRFFGTAMPESEEWKGLTVPPVADDSTLPGDVDPSVGNPNDWIHESIGEHEITYEDSLAGLGGYIRAEGPTVSPPKGPPDATGLLDGAGTRPETLDPRAERDYAEFEPARLLHFAFGTSLSASSDRFLAGLAENMPPPPDEPGPPSTGNPAEWFYPGDSPWLFPGEEARGCGPAPPPQSGPNVGRRESPVNKLLRDFGRRLWPW